MTSGVLAQLRVRKEVQQVLHQPVLDAGPFSRPQTLGCEIAHRIEHAETANVASSHKALVDERSQEGDTRIRDPLRGVERPTSSEHRQCGEQPSFVWAQQIERPLDGCPKRLVSCLGISPCAEKVESAAQALE